MSSPYTEPQVLSTRHRVARAQSALRHPSRIQRPSTAVILVPPSITPQQTNLAAEELNRYRLVSIDLS